MDDLTLRYYDAEMRYLLEAGEEFARAHPEQAAMLNLDKAGARDPFVERLFEGFAFLMGRMREKLDDDLPELTEGVVSLLWPHYLRTIPSMSVVEFTPDWPEMKEPMTMAKGFEVLSRPIGEKGTRCRYTTTKAIALQPLSLERVQLATDTDGRSVITLRFTCSQLTDWRRVDLSHIPLYCNADAPLACAMHEAFTLNVARMWLRIPDEVDRRPLDGYFSALGFGEDDGLWPEDGRSFRGYQLLLEYFTFREKFMFIDLRGLETVVFPAGLAWFEIDVVLAERWEHDFRFSEKQLRLHCVPVINLFPLESDPLTINSLQTEYPLRPMRVQDGHTEIYTVDSVISSHQQVYAPFSSFRHKGGILRLHIRDSGHACLFPIFQNTVGVCKGCLSRLHDRSFTGKLHHIQRQLIFLQPFFHIGFLCRHRHTILPKRLQNRAVAGFPQLNIFRCLFHSIHAFLCPADSDLFDIAHTGMPACGAIGKQQLDDLHRQTKPIIKAEQQAHILLRKHFPQLFLRGIK